MTNEKYTDFNPDANIEVNQEGDIVAPGPDASGPTPDFETDEDRQRYSTRHDKSQQILAEKHEAQYADAQLENLMDEYDYTAASDLGLTSLAAEGITAPDTSESAMPRVFSPSPNWKEKLKDDPVDPGANDTPKQAQARQEELLRDAHDYAKTGTPMYENKSEAEQIQGIISSIERYGAELREIEIDLHDVYIEQERRLQLVTRKQQLEQRIAARSNQLKTLGHESE